MEGTNPFENLGALSAVPEGGAIPPVQNGDDLAQVQALLSVPPAAASASVPSDDVLSAVGLLLGSAPAAASGSHGGEMGNLLSGLARSTSIEGIPEQRCSCRRKCINRCVGKSPAANAVARCSAA